MSDVASGGVPAAVTEHIVTSLRQLANFLEQHPGQYSIAEFDISRAVLRDHAAEKRLGPGLIRRKPGPVNHLSITLSVRGDTQPHAIHDGREIETTRLGDSVRRYRDVDTGQERIAPMDPAPPEPSD